MVQRSISEETDCGVNNRPIFAPNVSTEASLMGPSTTRSVLWPELLGQLCRCKTSIRGNYILFHTFDNHFQLSALLLHFAFFKM